jgi:hypothetical protein
MDDPRDRVFITPAYDASSLAVGVFMLPDTAPGCGWCWQQWFGGPWQWIHEHFGD